MRVLRDLVGHTLSDRYRLVSRLAGGGMGEVFRGHDLLLDRPVAVKILQPSLAGDRDLVERFKLEARAAARLNHPNIVSIHDWGAEDERTYYMVMEYVAGTDLREVMTLRGAMDPSAAVDVLVAVCDALTVAHEAGLVHRDVKPENILIARDGTVKVADFGIAIVADADRTMPGGNIPGTLRYLSPEQARGLAATTASDIWSAGAVLFELLTGEPLFEGGGIDALQRRMSEPPRAPSEVRPDVPQVVDEIVLRACDSEPVLRFETAAQMARELRLAPIESGPGVASLLDEITGDIELPDMQPTSYLKRKRKRRGFKKIAALVAAGVMALLVGFKAMASLLGPTMVPVPKVVGFQLTRAETITEEAGLVLEIDDRVHRLGTRPGEVLEQSPATGQREEGSKVEVVVSAGAPFTRVPKLIGRSVRTASADLRKSHLDLGAIETEFSLEEKGIVLDQDPATGKVRWGSTVNLVVSKGPRPVRVPEVARMTEAEAVKALRRAGFEPVVSAVYSERVREGIVIGTTPTGGETAGEGSEVLVQVSAGPRYEKVRVPDVRGMSVDQARTKLASVGLRVRVEKSCPGGSTVVETHPVPGTVVRENDVIALFVC